MTTTTEQRYSHSSKHNPFIFTYMVLLGVWSCKPLGLETTAQAMVANK